MLLKAAEAFNIDLCESWTVGDGMNDVLAGKAAGTRTALIKNNSNITQNTDNSKNTNTKEKTQPSCGKTTEQETAAGGEKQENQDPNNTIKPDELVGSLLDFVEKGLD